MLLKKLMFVPFCFVMTYGAHAQSASQEDISAGIANLPWQAGVGTHLIAKSNSVIVAAADDAFLQGKDAWKFMELVEGHDHFKPDALVMKLEGSMAFSTAIYTFSDAGYLKMDDWEEFIDADDLLSVLKSGTEEANKVRKEGYPKLYIDDWVELPTLDRKTATAYWAIKLHSDDGELIINAEAVKLGRNGFTSIAWAGSPDQFQGAVGTLQPALNAYHYNDGFRYADFAPGDTVAALGIGALVYKTLTGSSKKISTALGAGAFAIAIAFAKKLWFLIFLPFVFLWGWVKNRFKS